MGFVLVAYLVIGLALPVLPLYVHDRLHRNSFVVGIIGGSPFAAAFVSRIAAGRFTDRRGAKPAVTAGLLVAAGGGFSYLIALCVAGYPDAAAGVLVLGRALLGVADGFIITGALSWGLASLGAQSTGKVMAWVGTSLYAAFAIGAPAGSALYASYGFVAIAFATMLVPLCAIALIVPMRAPPPPRHMQPVALRSVVGAVWQPGIGVALSGVGFGAILSFIALLFAEHRWTPVWLAFSAMSVAFIVGRLGFGGLPDRIGGANVTLACVIVEASGLSLIWLAPSALVAVAGIVLSALGYSLVYPALGVEAVRRSPPQSRGVAMGTYTAFLDLSLGLSNPLLGLVAARSSVGDVYLVSSLLALSAAAVAVRLWRHRVTGYTSTSPSR